mmetsp:Transcript_2406/g.4343  ORF Transcript_2406/g.4343 Transcript_2406/m.4343 type:complete len:213 (+) Transcript_2406:145-783(+)
MIHSKHFRGCHLKVLIDRQPSMLHIERLRPVNSEIFKPIPVNNTPDDVILTCVKLLNHVVAVCGQVDRTLLLDSWRVAEEPPGSREPVHLLQRVSSLALLLQTGYVKPDGILLPLVVSVAVYDLLRQRKPFLGHHVRLEAAVDCYLERGVGLETPILLQVRDPLLPLLRRLPLPLLPHLLLLLSLPILLLLLQPLPLLPLPSLFLLLLLPLL